MIPWKKLPAERGHLCDFVEVCVVWLCLLTVSFAVSLQDDVGARVLSIAVGVFRNRKTLPKESMVDSVVGSLAAILITCYKHGTAHVWSCLLVF